MSKKIYVVSLVDTYNYKAFISEKKATEELWKLYQEECLPFIPEEDREEVAAEDRRNLEEQGYIEDYGWITEVELDEGE